MSLKKDRFNSFDKKYMKFAIDLAINQNGLTGTNPSVGCVIVKNKRIISYGATHINGTPHAMDSKIDIGPPSTLEVIRYKSEAL